MTSNSRWIGGRFSTRLRHFRNADPAAFSLLALELGYHGRDAVGRAGFERPGLCRPCVVADKNSLIERLACHRIHPFVVRKRGGLDFVRGEVVVFIGTA